MRKLISFVALLSLFLTHFTLYAASLAKGELALQREMYTRAEYAFKKNDQINYLRLKQQLTTYPLYPYLLYEELKRDLNRHSPSQPLQMKLQQFTQSYPDFPYLSSLNNQWLMQLAKHKKWQWYVDSYQPTSETALQCHYYYGKYQLSQNSAYLKKAEKLWAVGYSQPDACNSLFALWQKTLGINQQLMWQRFKLALEDKNFILSHQLSKQLPAREREIAELWEKLIKDPSLILQDKFVHSLKATPQLKSEILGSGLKLLAKIDAEKALTWWGKHQTSHLFSKKNIDQIQRDIGIYLAHQKNPRAKDWLAYLPDTALDNVAKEWRVRLAIAAKEWPEVLKWIAALPPELQQDKAWLYWQARALEHTGQNSQAQTIYQQLRQQRSYYGFLASLRQHAPFKMHHRDIKVPDEVTKNVASLPAMQRFEQLRLIGKHSTARVEWFRATDKMNEAQLIAAAKTAHKMGLFDIAILTVAKTNYKDDIRLRFPLGYEDEIIRNASKHNLDPAWVFAIARQESAFFTDAYSAAGARGLMQLMPTTAQMLAKQYNIAYFSEDSLHQPKVNISLGSVYLKNLKQRMHNHPIIATSSYNAGPNRTLKWLPTEPMEAEIWIENIPYKETREYVKNVVTFTGIYRQQLGYPPAISLMMKPISAQPLKI